MSAKPKHEVAWDSIRSKWQRLTRLILKGPTEQHDAVRDWLTQQGYQICYDLENDTGRFIISAEIGQESGSGIPMPGARMI